MRFEPILQGGFDHSRLAYFSAFSPTFDLLNDLRAQPVGHHSQADVRLDIRWTSSFSWSWHRRALFHHLAGK